MVDRSNNLQIIISKAPLSWYKNIGRKFYDRINTGHKANLFRV
jgi:hypothetical protein